MNCYITNKIWDLHVVQSKEEFPDVLSIDLHLIHEVTSPQAFEELRKRGLKIHALERTLATVDHNVSTTFDRETLPNPVSRNQILMLRKNCKEFGVKLWDMGGGRQGIVHIVGPEQGLTQPGMTIVCGDSHTSTHGAFHCHFCPCGRVLVTREQFRQVLSPYIKNFYRQRMIMSVYRAPAKVHTPLFIFLK